MDSIFRYVERNGEITITGLQKDVTETSIVIPDDIGGLPVTKIGFDAFRKSAITDIKIGKNIKEIGAGAFSACTSLSKFDFSNIESIGEEAFSESGLQEVDLPHNIQEVEIAAFSHCTSLKAVQWNVKNKIIPAFCFRDCSSLSAFDFSNVEYVGEEAFSGSGLQKLDLPHNIQEVGDWAFSYCKSLKAVSWAAQTKNIPQNCFCQCLSLSTFDFSNVEDIGKEAFSGSGLREVYFTQSTNKIEENAFSGCQYLIKVEWLSDYSIVDKVFENCRNLKEVNISDKVKNIATDAFKGCPNVEFTFI